jgi:hypothetical protein
MTEVSSHKHRDESPSSSWSDSDSDESLSSFLKERHGDRDSDQRGFLTPKDRELLIQELEGEKLTKEQRYRIRKRLRNGIKDFELVSHCVENSDKKRVFREMADEESSHNYFAHLGALVYEAVDASGYDSEEFIEDSIRIAQELDDDQGIDVGISIDNSSGEDIKHRSR